MQRILRFLEILFIGSVTHYVDSQRYGFQFIEVEHHGREVGLLVYHAPYAVLISRRKMRVDALTDMMLPALV